jgi:hypothetical protein
VDIKGKTMTKTPPATPEWPVPELEARITAEFAVDAGRVERKLLREHWIATALMLFIPLIGWAALIFLRNWSYPERARLYAQSIRVGLTADAVISVRNRALLHNSAATPADARVQVINDNSQQCRRGSLDFHVRSRNGSPRRVGESHALSLHLTGCDDWFTAACRAGIWRFGTDSHNENVKKKKLFFLRL